MDVSLRLGDRLRIPVPPNSKWMSWSVAKETFRGWQKVVHTIYGPGNPAPVQAGCDASSSQCHIPALRGKDGAFPVEKHRSVMKETTYVDCFRD